MGNKLKMARVRAGMTQEMLAEKSGVCRTTIWEIENDKPRNTSTGTLKRLAKALDSTIEDIFFNGSV